MQPVKCPNCDKPTRLSADNPYRPFCSERCKLIDLGEWFEESRGIAAEEADQWEQSPSHPGSESYQ